MPTKQNPKDIKAVDSVKHGNLKEEILDIKSSISSKGTEIANNGSNIETLKQRQDATDLTITNINSEIITVKQSIANVDQNVETVQEVINARAGYLNLDERLDHIEGLNAISKATNLSTSKVYTYDNEGKVLTEQSTGDLNYLITFSYNDKGDLLLEEHYQNNALIGHKQYIYSEEGFINKIISVNGDILEVATQNGIYQDLFQKVESLDSLNIAEELDGIKSNLFIGKYDGDTMLNTVNNLSVRLEVIEDIMPGEIYDILKVPEIIERLGAVEIALSNSMVHYEFLYKEAQAVYTLPKTVVNNNLKVYADGIYLTIGPTNDYILMDDKITINFIVPILEGSNIVCEYY